jgi:hypothetical protein
LEGKGRTERIPNTPDADAVIRSRHGGLSRVAIVAADGTHVIEFDSGVAVPAFDRPDASASPVNSIENLAPDLLTKSGGPHPLVFSRRPGWFEVALYEPSASFRSLKKVWIQNREETWSFHPVSREESDQILSVNWGIEDGPAVSIKEVRSVGNTLWIRVDVFYDSECVRLLENLEDQPRPVVASGWMRAHAADGNPALWFETYCD